VFCTTQWMQRHTTSHQENKIRDIFSGGQVAGRQKPAHHVKLARSLVIRIPHKRGIRDSVATFSSVLRGIGYLYVHIQNTGIWNASRLNKPIPTF